MLPIPDREGCNSAGIKPYAVYALPPEELGDTYHTIDEYGTLQSARKRLKSLSNGWIGSIAVRIRVRPDPDAEGALDIEEEYI